ncbi:MAG: GntR family transcriptional regulator [Stappiaceae bacterium]
MAETAVKTSGRVSRVYDQVREMATSFEFKPEERINEVALSQKLGASRTPVREALNRLVAEGFLTFSEGRGFFCRPLSPSLVMDLYEARMAIECEALRLAVARASDDEIDQVIFDLEETHERYSPDSSPEDLVRLDENFHLALARLSRNVELMRLLENINGRIRYIRLVDMQGLRGVQDKDGVTLSAHRTIADALKNRDAAGAVSAMRSHIERRREEATEAVRIAYSQLYVPVD